MHIKYGILVSIIVQSAFMKANDVQFQNLKEALIVAGKKRCAAKGAVAGNKAHDRFEASKKALKNAVREYVRSQELYAEQIAMIGEEKLIKNITSQAKLLAHREKIFFEPFDSLLQEYYAAWSSDDTVFRAWRKARAEFKKAYKNFRVACRAVESTEYEELRKIYRPYKKEIMVAQQ